MAGRVPERTAMMRAQIDAIVKAFAPEMERITALEASKEAKVQIAEDWLRSHLEKFEHQIRQDCKKPR
jgi:hypothetical protein